MMGRIAGASLNGCPLLYDLLTLFVSMVARQVRLKNNCKCSTDMCSRARARGKGHSRKERKNSGRVNKTA